MPNLLLVEKVRVGGKNFSPLGQLNPLINLLSLIKALNENDEELISLVLPSFFLFSEFEVGFLKAGKVLRIAFFANGRKLFCSEIKSLQTVNRSFHGGSSIPHPSAEMVKLVLLQMFEKEVAEISIIVEYDASHGTKEVKFAVDPVSGALIIGVEFSVST